MKFVIGLMIYYLITSFVWNLNIQHRMQTENQKGEDREKILFGKKAHETFVNGFYQGAYVGWTVKHFFYCPMRKEYGIMLTKK
jgi:hypothetical protein